MKLLGFVVFLEACALHGAREPAVALEIVGLSSQKNPELARQAAADRALQRAAWVAKPDALRFTFTRTVSGEALKLFAPETAFSGVAPKVERQLPFGARAVVTILRTAQAQQALVARHAVHVTASAQGLDLATAQTRADRAALSQAIAQSTATATATGTLTVVNYAATAAGQVVTVTADIAVALGAPASAPTSTFDIEREEVESE
jgi:hypothetical protein